MDESVNLNEFYYGDFVGFESTSVEYKLFTLFPKGINLNTDILKFGDDLINSGRWIFNESVKENLEYYIEYYLPKYAAAYLSPYSEVQNGELIIGISDDGIIYGIPYGNDDNIIDFINLKVDNIIKSNLSHNLVNNKDIFDFIKWEIIKVNKSYIEEKKEIFMSNLNNKIEEYNFQKNIYYQKYKKFVKKKKVWYELVDRYNGRLHNMLNDKEKRQELINYISIKYSSSDLANKKSLIKKLKSNFKFNSITNHELTKVKDDKSKIWYWVTRWKDSMISLIKDIKPNPPSGISTNLYPLSILTTIIDMIPKWVINEDINLYVVKFKFKKPEDNIEISYLDSKDKSDSFKSCFRCSLDNIPCCHP